MATEQRNLKLSYVDAPLMSAFMQFTPGVGSIYYDAVNKVLRVGDGSTPGGIPQEDPPGKIIGYIGRTIPRGYLLCNGGTIQRSQYPRLVPVLGNIPEFQGDGSTTLVLPNLQGRFMEFTTDTNQVGKYVEAGLPNITGKVEGIRRVDNIQEAATSAMYWAVQNFFMKTVETEGTACADIRFDASRNNAIYGKSSTVQPPSVRVLPLIRF
mgnify:CR=1 FL=1